MVPRRRRWRRTAAKAALVALGLTVLGLLGSGEGEELLAAALAAWGEGRGAWGEGRDGGDWGVGVGGAGEAWGGSWGGAFMNGERGNGAGLVNGAGGKGAGLAGGGAGFVNGGAGFMNGEGGEWREAIPNGGVGGEKGGAGVPNGSWGVTNGGPGGPRVPPGCVGLLSGGSGDLAEGPWWLPRDPRTPRVLLAPPPCAPPAPPFLLLLVPSAPAHLERRLAVRDTWGGSWAEPGTPPSRTVFVLGVPPGPDGQRELLSESRQHGDILQGDFGDSYANLTRKTLLLLRWARACCGGAPFLLKADDDVFVNVPAVATYLATWPAPPRLYLGRVHWGVAPNRDPRSRHHVPPGVYGAARYPPYCSGTAYVLSRQAATGVLGGALAVPLAMPEDVWVGLGARRAGLAPRHSARFGGSLRVPPERCCLGRALLSAHRLRPPEIRRVWEGLRELREEPAGCPRILHGALGRLRCRVMAWGERIWGGGDVME